MNEGYSLDFQKSNLYGKTSSDGYDSGFSGGFVLAQAQPYPSIADELKKDVAILTSSLRIRDGYIDKLRKARDSLISKLDFATTKSESFEKQIRSYREFFCEPEEKERNGDRKNF